MRELKHFIIISDFDRLDQSHVSAIKRSYTGIKGGDVLSCKDVLVLNDDAVFKGALRSASHTEELRLSNVRKYIQLQCRLISLEELYSLVERERNDTLFVIPARMTPFLKQYLEDLCKSHNAVFRVSAGTEVDVQNRKKLLLRAKRKTKHRLPDNRK